MTKEERRLWYDYLKRLPVKAHRQMVLGSYIVDFCIPVKKTVIEVDGFQHGEPQNIAADRERDKWLASHGYRVLRYANRDIDQRFEAVCRDIECWLYPDGLENDEL